MFVHKSNPLALSFATAMVIGFAAQTAQADRLKSYQQDDYCSAPDVCSQRQIGIIQKTRDGVNYFYGGSDVAPPEVTYIYLRDSDIDEPVVAPVRTSNLSETTYHVPFSNKHWLRVKKDHWKWNRRHLGPMDLPGLQPGSKYMGP